MWSPERPLKELCGAIREYYQEHAEYLYKDLRERRLSVVLAPAPEPQHCMHMIRKTEMHNPAWYSELYWSENSFRRDLSLKSLDRIRKAEDLPLEKIKYPHYIFTDRFRYRYDAVYRKLIHDDLTKGYYLEGEFIQPEDEIRAYFDMPPIIFPVKKKQSLDEDEILPF